MGDIAAEAGVAHGLLYHYFASKNELLDTIFRETWSELVAALDDAAALAEPAPVRLRRAAAIVLRAWQRDPDLVRVLIREVTRSPQLQREIGEIGHAFDALERIVQGGQANGDFRADLDPRLASYVLYGALEAILTGWVLGQLPDGEQDVARAERAVVAIVSAGLVSEQVPVQA